MAPHSGSPDGAALSQLLHPARRARGIGQLSAARQALAQVHPLVPGDAECHRLLGIASLMDRDGQRFVVHLRDALAALPQDFTIYMTLGKALFETDAAQAGLDSLQRACELAPDDAAA